MVYGYIRVSTNSQKLNGNSIEEQEIKIKERYSDVEIVIETYSGAKERKIFIELLERLKEKDVLVVSSLDRFCRTVKEGLEYIDMLMKKKVIIHILNMGLIEDNPMGKLMITNLLAFAEFERSMIIERTQAGKKIAKQNPNFKEGRPKKFSKNKINQALELLKTQSYKQVEELTGISKSTLYRSKKEN